MRQLTQEMKPGPAIDAINAHTHADGLGVPIPTDGLEDGAVTRKKIAPKAVSSAEIDNGAVGVEQLSEDLSNSIQRNITAGVNAPGYYKRDVPFYFHHKTIIASPHRLWLNISTRGFILEKQKLIDISHDEAFDSKAQLWQADHDYQIDDVVYPSDTKSGYYYRCTVAGRSSQLTPVFPQTLGQTYNDGNVVWICEYDFTVAANRAGRDFYIYACIPKTGVEPVIVVSANATVPLRYTADNSRKIGGFHCECMDVGTPTEGHWLTGWKAGEILPFSVWDLHHRPKGGAVEGMSWIPGHGWMSIYLLSSTGDTEGKNRSLSSKYQGIIADGTSTPTWRCLDHIETLAKSGQCLPTMEALISAGWGTLNGTPIKEQIDPITTGGHKNTRDTRVISNYGMEDTCGCEYSWAKDSYSGLHNQCVGGCWANGFDVASYFCASDAPGTVGLYPWIGARSFAEDVVGNTVDILALIKTRMEATRK